MQGSGTNCYRYFIIHNYFRSSFMPLFMVSPLSNVIKNPKHQKADTCLWHSQDARQMKLRSFAGLHNSVNHKGISLVSFFNPLHPKISLYILYTVLHTFPKMLSRRICRTIKEFLLLMIISFILATLIFDSGFIYCQEKLDASHS